MAGLNSRPGLTENTPLLGRPGGGSDRDADTPWKRLKKHMTVDIDKSWADLVLLFCYIITGLLDSSAVFIWGSFVSMQTGTSSHRHHRPSARSCIASRKHRVLGPWAGSSFRGHSLDQGSHFHILFLSWILLLQPVPSLPLAAREMGSRLKLSTPTHSHHCSCAGSYIWRRHI